MKKIFIALWLFLLCGIAQAQTTTYTPNLNLALPPAAPGTWGEQYNNNFSTLDSAITGTFGTVIAFSGDITPAQITADQTDYNPTGLTTANVVRLSSDAARSINSLVGGADGRMIILYNVGSQQITLKNNSGLGTAANQFLLNADVVLSTNQGAIVQYDTVSSRWRLASSVGTTGGGSAHIIQDEASNLTARPTLNFTGSGITCTDNGGSNRTDCDVPSGSVNTAAAFTWTGAHSWRDNNFSLLDDGDTSKILKFDIAGFTTATTRTMTLPNASTRLLGDSDFSATGGMFRTGAGTYVGRTLAGTTNRITVTNGDGIAGAPTFNLGSLAVQTDQSNTYSTGDQDFGLASSFKFPSSTGATPTLSGRCAYDTTANRLKCGFNGSTVTLAVLSEVQPLNSNLTALAGLTGTNNTVPIFTAAGAMVGSLLPSCADSAGNHLNYDNTTRVFSCGTSSTGGLSGLTTNKYLLATGATSAGTSGVLSESGGILNVSGGATFGSSPFLIFDTSAIASTDKTWTILNFSGTIRPSTGVITAGHNITIDANGLLVDNGAPGTGTWTDGSTNTGTNKTLRDALAGGTGNAIWTPVRASWDAGSLTPDGTNCPDPIKQTINSGPIVYAFVCADSNSSTFDGHLTLPITMAGNLATVKFRLTVNDVDSASQVFGGGFKAQCRASGTAPNSTWGTAQTVAITMVTANNDYSATTAAVTPDGTCSAGAELFWRFTVDATTNTDDGDARVISVAMEQAS